MKRWFIRLATILFLLQIIHLIWLTSDVVIFRLFGIGFFPRGLDFLLSIVDYTEIPALISVSVIYIHDLIRGENTKRAWRNLILLNSQWLHLFWITDEVVIVALTGAVAVNIPRTLAWLAIAIDYFELPVMWDTAKRAFAKRSE